MAPSATLPEPEPEYVVVFAGKGTIKREILTGSRAKPTFSTIPQSELYRVIREFFALPLEEKMGVHINKSASIKGYEALLETKLDATTRGDLKEAFNIGDDPYDPEQNVPSNFDISSYPKNGNQWPSALPKFRTLMYKYNAAVLSFSKKLMRIIALALDLPETYFDHMAAFPMAGLRALHYPSQEIANDIGIGAHADYSWFTLVNQLSPTPALEVLNHNGQWISAPPIPGTLVVNVGDFLEMATNNVFVSTVHRVVNKTGEERYSIPYFFSPSKDVMIETVPTCVKEDGVKMTPIMAGDWQQERLLRARYKHPSSIAARAKGEI
ncbi:Clavaminate synthase-like protein [Cadophora sp. DSE1049]|nr:Clavaminate synthase-like protein [Cadophora sp. DSE1049]